MKSTGACPTQKRLRDLLDGVLPEPEQADLNQHLESCPVCQQALESLVAGRESWSGAAQQLRDADFSSAPVLDEAMQALKQQGDGMPTQAESGAPAQVRLDFLNPSQDPKHLGRLDHYEILEMIGQGGMGIVFKALDTVLDRIVAIKVMAPYLTGNATARKRFVREAQAAAAVCHDHVVTIHAVSEANGVPYLVMQYIAGVSLQECLDRHGPLELKEILRIGMQTAGGLAAAHAQGLVHRDIKPANILLENGVQRVKITDFGLARTVDDASLSQSGIIAGTPQYLAPEQAYGDPVDHRADLFSLGSVLYALCTGRAPFRASTAMAVLKRVCEESPRPIREINPDIPESLAALIAKLHAKHPDDRFASAAEVALLLGQHLAHAQQPGIAPSPPQVRPPVALRQAPPARAVRWPLMVVGLVVLGLCLVPALFIFLLLGYFTLRYESIPPQAASIDQGIVGDLLVPQPPEVEGPMPKVGEVVHRVKLFAISDRAGRGQRSYDSLAEAVANASDGDTLVIHGNGPFETDSVNVKGQALTIRAGAGYRPVFQLSPASVQAALPLLDTNGRLVVEGLELRSTYGPYARGQLPFLVRSVGAPVYLANCRFAIKGDGIGLWADESPTCIVRNCEFVATHMFSRVDWVCPSGGRMSLENNVLASGDVGLSFHLRHRDLRNVSLHLQHNTVIAKDPISLFLDMAPEPAAADVFRTDGSGNIFDGLRGVFQLEQSPDYLFTRKGKALDSAGAEALLQRLVSWKLQQSFYSVPPQTSLLNLTVKNQPVPTTRDYSRLEAWREFWGLDREVGMNWTGAVPYRGGNARLRLSSGATSSMLGQAPQTVAAKDFQLSPNGPTVKNGRNVGADVNLVGPQAYGRWRNTGDYREWQRLTTDRP